MSVITSYGNVAFVTIEKSDTSAEQYANDRYYSLFGTDSGTLFLIDMDNRVIAIHSNGAIYKVVTSAYADTITDNVYRYASAGDYFQCSTEVFTQIYTLLEGNRIMQPMKYINNALLSLLLALMTIFAYICFYSRTKIPSDHSVLKDTCSHFSCILSKTTHYEQSVTDLSLDIDLDDSYSSSRSSRHRSSSRSSSRRGGGGSHRF